MLRVSVVAALSVLASACVQRIEEPSLSGEALVARGEYLVLGIGGCNDCHTPMTPQGPDMAQTLQGATLIFGPLIEMPFAPVAPPLAGGPAGYTDEQFQHFLETGARPDGSHTLPPMPQFRLNAEDARAVVAYIKTLPAAAAATPDAPPAAPATTP
ncbi:MAG: c-type cytochrome [Hyphomonadaceae bacterium]|nr:c-type cytochrome [Hyphomonadaceae bacterium]